MLIYRAFVQKLGFCCVAHLCSLMAIQLFYRELSTLQNKIGLSPQYRDPFNFPPSQCSFTNSLCSSSATLLFYFFCFCNQSDWSFCKVRFAALLPLHIFFSTIAEWDYPSEIENVPHNPSYHIRYLNKLSQLLPTNQ